MPGVGANSSPSLAGASNFLALLRQCQVQDRRGMPRDLSADALSAILPRAMKKSRKVSSVAPKALTASCLGLALLALAILFGGCGRAVQCLDGCKTRPSADEFVRVAARAEDWGLDPASNPKGPKMNSRIMPTIELCRFFTYTADR